MTREEKLFSRQHMFGICAHSFCFLFASLHILRLRAHFLGLFWDLRGEWLKEKQEARRSMNLGFLLKINQFKRSSSKMLRCSLQKSDLFTIVSLLLFSYFRGSSSRLETAPNMRHAGKKHDKQTPTTQLYSLNKICKL